VPGIVGPALSERVAALTSWRWIFLGLLPFVLIAGAMIVPAMMRMGAPEREWSEPTGSWMRRPMVEAVRVASGAALVVAGLSRGGWEVAPFIAGGLVVGLGSFRRLTPTGTLGAARGLPATVLSRGMVMFAFFGADAFVPYVVENGKEASSFTGSLAVTAATMGWTSAAWVQQRHIVRTGEAYFVRISYVFLTVGLCVIAAASAVDSVTVWAIHVGALIAGFGVGLGYSAHAQATLRVADPERFGQATAGLQLCDNLGVALGAGLSGAIIAAGDSSGWQAGTSMSVALVAPITVAVLGAAIVAKRLPPKAAA
jgi:hypothetical protein